MSIKIFIAPSVIYKNIGVGEYGNEEERCQQIGYIVERILKKIPEFEVRRNKYRYNYASEIANKCNSFIGALDKGYYISIHTNSGGGQGIEILTDGKNDRSNKLANNLYSELSKIYPRSDKLLGINSGKNTTAELSIPKAPAVLINLAYHDDEDDVYWVVNNINEIAKAIVIGIINTVNDEYEITIEYPEENMTKSLNDIELDESTNDSKMNNLEKRIQTIEEKLEGLSEFITVNNMDNVDKFSENILNRMENIKK